MKTNKIMKAFLMLATAIAVTFGIVGCDDRSANKIIQTLQQQSSGSQKAIKSPKATAQSFINRCLAADLDGAKKYFTQNMRSRMTGEGSGIGLQLMLQNCRITDVEESFGSATVYIRVQNPVTEDWQTITLSMILEDGAWKISSLDNDED